VPFKLALHAPRFIAGISLKTHKLSLKTRIRGLYRRAVRRIKHSELYNRILTLKKAAL
jgi:hypothetical protein